MQACIFQQVDTETSTVTIYNAIKATTRQITQRHAIYVMFSCTYVLGPHYTQLAPEIRPKSHEIQIYSGNLHDDFNVTLDLWLDQFHQSRYFYADKLATQEYIYVMIGATTDDWDRYKVQVCWCINLIALLIEAITQILKKLLAITFLTEVI